MKRALVLNIGSSSVKALLASLEDKQTLWEDMKSEVNEHVFDAVLHAVPHRPDVIGHRIVQGGARFREPARINPEVRAAIAAMAPLAPTHNRLELAAIDAATRVFGEALPQVAVFDTAFHATLAPAAYTYPGPREWLEKGIRRYGFHGINHAYIARRTAELAPNKPRLVSCHLGSGCSLAAIANGRSIDTTMGFTPLEGLMMSTRSGSIDPAILLYLQRHDHATPEDLDRILNKESGLKGLSGVSSDLREIRKAIAQGNANAQLAYDVFLHRLIREIGAMTAILGGLDALAFTGGIGENDAQLRADTVAHLGFLGLNLDAAKNSATNHDTDITTGTDKARILVIHAQEEWEIANACACFLD